MFFKAKKNDDDSDMRQSLTKLNILDTPLEERFERITRLVCMTLGVPISSFSLIDGERQWFKSIQGLNSSETPISVSFCAHTILGDEIMVVPDAKKDVRFANNPLVKNDPNITFYAGCPVRAPDGRNIGALCAIDQKVRSLTLEQASALKDLAHMIESELKVAQLSKTQYELINELDNVHRAAIIDPLTRIWNANGIKEILKREWAAGIRKNTPLTVVRADIDGLQKINERKNREAGDTVIREVAKRFLAALRAEDAVARLDNDDFLLVLPDSDPDRLLTTLHRIHEAVTSKLVKTSQGDIDIAMSFGAISEIPKISFETDDLLRSAESALKKAKANGGDRVEITDFI